MRCTIWMRSFGRVRGISLCFEIERKFLIRMPDASFLQSAEKDCIEQTYLLCQDGSERVRKRSRRGKITYTHTQKKRITDLRRIENERVIREAEYQQLLSRADPGRRMIIKDRYCVDYMGQLLEIDVYPFYEDRAILEIELRDESQEIHIPPWIQLVRELTEDRRYTNASMAKTIPFEEI